MSFSEPSSNNDSKFDPCHHCGDTENGFIIKSFWSGPVTDLYDINGLHDWTDNDRVLTISGGDTVRCAKCKKIRRDVYVNRGQILPIKKESYE